MIVVEGSGLVRRIGLAGKLIGHEDWVNTIEFNRCGDRLVSTGETCCGMWQVRLGQVADNGNLQTLIELGKHNGRVHKLAVEPGSPHMFYSCGEDGFVQRVS
ncbi:putative transcription factor WD40-like family [Helianthus annuus]|nr:putative transcription factor WD40-like family [Helianthus annuus]